ncbi:MAG TPA: DUF1634 domain-containing protein [Bryobacteraceae bacterium]|nr:DUF1634 domain-containing protein [Bryobacteraceae bacterium]
MERIIGQLLRFGVVFSSAVVLLGALCLLPQHGRERVAFADFRPAPEEFRGVSGAIHAAARKNCRGVIQLGLLLLIATPIARVAFSLAAFAVERDWIYVCITFVVLAILLGGFFYRQ